MISRFFLALALAALMIVSSVGSYIYLGSRQSKVAAVPEKPTTATPRAQPFTLPGTLYLAQSGAIYSFSLGRFHQLTQELGWTQPSIYPDGSAILVVRRGPFYSDVYALTRFGGVISQLTDNNKTIADISGYHWSFYPRLTADQSTIFMSYDEPKYGYDVTMSIWALPVGAAMRQAHLWSISNDYTGGDVQPIPLSNGNVLYTKYDYGPDGQLISRIWITSGPETYRNPGRPLTQPGEDCREPSLSRDGTRIAYICTYEKQISQLVIASFDGSNIGPTSTVITDQLVAQPTWAPDGSGIAYLAPGSPNGPFQLWFLPKAAYTAPPPTPVPTPTPGGPYNGPLPSPTPAPVLPPVKPIQVTINVAFDATSPLAWVA
jgi:hypothetical protein